MNKENESNKLKQIKEAIQQNSELSSLKAIRAKCLDCACGSHKEIRLCQVPTCPLWPSRLGIRPKTAQKEGKMLDWDEVKGQ